MWLTVLGQGREQGCQRPTLSHPHMFLCYEDPSQFPNPSKYKYMQILILTQSEPNSNPNSWKSVDFKKKKKKSPQRQLSLYLQCQSRNMSPPVQLYRNTHTHISSSWGTLCFLKGDLTHHLCPSGSRKWGTWVKTSAPQHRRARAVLANFFFLQILQI